jgi:hypothetical protein
MLIIQGSRFFYPNGTQFFIKAIAYSNDARSAPGSSSFIDTISDELSCTRDIPYLQRLGINVLDVRDVDNKTDHSSCMSLLQSAGIYVLVRADASANTKFRNGSVVTPFDSSFIDSSRSFKSNLKQLFFARSTIWFINYRWAYRWSLIIPF